MSIERRIRTLEQRTPNPDARRPVFPVLWDEAEEPPANLPPGSLVARVVWRGPEEAEGGTDAT